jgi:hypothetical protein
MANIIQVRCNGPGHHINEVNVDEALNKAVVFRLRVAPRELPERLVLRCKECEEGRVILTRAMFQPHQ